jgi:hypothetical protein
MMMSNMPMIILTLGRRKLARDYLRSLRLFISESIGILILLGSRRSRIGIESAGKCILIHIRMETRAGSHRLQTGSPIDMLEPLGRTAATSKLLFVGMLLIAAKLETLAAGPISFRVQHVGVDIAVRAESVKGAAAVSEEGGGGGGLENRRWRRGDLRRTRRRRRGRWGGDCLGGVGGGRLSSGGREVLPHKSVGVVIRDEDG